MSLETTTEEQAIIALLSPLCGGRVYDELPDETLLARDANKMIKPYIVISFGTIFALGSDRSIEGEAQQPHAEPIIIECWASVAAAARSTAGSVRSLLTGFIPSTNASEIALRGGSWFPQTDGSGRPVRYMQSVIGQMNVNMSFDIGVGPGPEPDPGDGEEFEQTTPAATWIIYHSLGRLPVVTIYVNNEVVLVPFTASDTMVTVTFPEPTAGIIVLS